MLTNQKSQLEKLSKNNVDIINNINEIKKIFTLESLYSNNPNIITDNDVLIFFDTPNYNSSYLVDLINEYFSTYEKLSFTDMSNILKLDNKNLTKEIDIVNEIRLKILSQTKKTKFYYCQDEDIYVNIFEKYISNRLKTDKQVPVILTIKGNIQNNKNKDIFIDIETLSPLNYNTIMKNMVFLYDYNQNF